MSTVGDISVLRVNSNIADQNFQLGNSGVNCSSIIQGTYEYHPIHLHETSHIKKNIKKKVSMNIMIS